MPATSPPLKALGEFLRSRRAEVDPASVPEHVISTVGRRRVAGLRREEAAQLAAVSTDYYTRVEQGRLAPTEQVLAAICRAFRLPPEQVVYAEELLQAERGPTVRASGREAAHDRLQLLLNQITELPGIVLGARMDVLAWNSGGAALVTDFAKLPRAERNYVSITFTDPTMRSLYEDWPDVARTCVGILRREAARRPDDPQLASLVGKLSIASPEFRTWWAEHRVAEQDFGEKVLNHPAAGRLHVQWDSFRYAGAADQQLVLWSARAGSPDADALRALSRVGPQSAE